jgi:hypothetical protein
MFDKAIGIIGNGFFDFMELYAVPESFDTEKLQILKPYNITIHATQGVHGFNPIDPNSKTEELRDNTVSKYIDYFNPRYIIMHPENGDDISVLQRRMNYFNDPRILVENMPKYPISWYSFIFFGYTFAQLEQIKNIWCSICLDFEKAVKSALAQGIDYKEFISEIINKFNPSYFHLSWCDFETKEDQHKDLRETDFDVKRIKDKLIEIANQKDIFLLFETPRIWKSFDNDLKNLAYFKQL